jgi:hypothetical protein
MKILRILISKKLRKNHFDVALWGVAKYIVGRRGGW